MYVSLYRSTPIGTHQLPSELQLILGDQAKENKLLDFATHYQIQSLSLYDLHHILPARNRALATFITKASQRYIKVSAVVGGNHDVAKLGSYQEGHHGTERFAGIVTEFEFWNSGKYPEFIALVKGIAASHALQDLPIAAYVGNRSVVRQNAKPIADNVHQIFLACYAVSPSQAAQATKDTRRSFNGLPVEVIPIFSAEGKTGRAGGEFFMGDWLRSQKARYPNQNPLKTAESEFNAIAGEVIQSYQYYEYAFMYHHLQ